MMARLAALPKRSPRDSGGGASRFEGEPAYQSSYGIVSGNARAIPDVAFDGDPSTGVAVYDSTAYNGNVGWFQMGGTSLGVPSWAGFIAIVDQTRATLGRPRLGSGGQAVLQSLYAAATGSSYATDYRDITIGANGICGTQCTAGVGYDFVTGVGTPLGSGLGPFLKNQ